MHTRTRADPPPVRIRLRTMRLRAGLTMRDVAEAISRSISSYQHYEDRYKRQHLPNDLVRDLMPVLRARGIDAAEIATLAPPSLDDLLAPAERRTPYPLKQTVSAAPSGDKGSAGNKWSDWPIDLPVYALSVKGRPADDWTFEVVGKMAWATYRPPVLRGNPGAYAVYAPDDYMAPRYIHNVDMLGLDPGAVAQPGDHVLVNLTRRPGDRGKPRGLIAVYVASDAKGWTFKQYSGPSRRARRLRYRHDDVASLDVVSWAGKSPGPMRDTQNSED